MRNSWGINWGEDGYMRIKIIDGNGICGIQTDCESCVTKWIAIFFSFQFYTFNS